MTPSNRRQAPSSVKKKKKKDNNNNRGITQEMKPPQKNSLQWGLARSYKGQVQPATADTWGDPRSCSSPSRTQMKPWEKNRNKVKIREQGVFNKSDPTWWWTTGASGLASGAASGVRSRRGP